MVPFCICCEEAETLDCKCGAIARRGLQEKLVATFEATTLLHDMIVPLLVLLFWLQPGMERRKDQGMKKRQGASPIFFVVVVVIVAVVVFEAVVVVVVVVCVVEREGESRGQGRERVR